MDYMGSRGALRASEEGIGMVRAVLWGDSFWQHYPRELALRGNEAGGKEVSWVVTVELGTRILGKMGAHTKGVMCGEREREGLRICSAPETMAGGREVGEGRRRGQKPSLGLPRKAGPSLGRPESDHPALNSQHQQDPEVPPPGPHPLLGSFSSSSRNHIA